MAYGVPPKHTRTFPAGSRGFAAESGVERREVIRPGSLPDGQARDGTPAGRMHNDAATRGYLHPEGVKLRNDYRGVGSKGITDGPDNPKVSSKGRRNDARFDRTDLGLDKPTNRSVGEQPAPMRRGSELAARLRAKDVSKPGTIEAKVEGFAPDGSGRFIPPSHPNSAAHKHTGHAQGSVRSSDTGSLDRSRYGGGK